MRARRACARASPSARRTETTRTFRTASESPPRRRRSTRADSEAGRVVRDANEGLFRVLSRGASIDDGASFRFVRARTVRTVFSAPPPRRRAASTFASASAAVFSAASSAALASTTLASATRCSLRRGARALPPPGRAVAARRAPFGPRRVPRSAPTARLPRLRRRRLGPRARPRALAAASPRPPRGEPPPTSSPRDGPLSAAPRRGGKAESAATNTRLRRFARAPARRRRLLPRARGASLARAPTQRAEVSRDRSWARARRPHVATRRASTAAAFGEGGRARRVGGARRGVERRRRVRIARRRAARSVSKARPLAPEAKSPAPSAPRCCRRARRAASAASSAAAAASASRSARRASRAARRESASAASAAARLLRDGARAAGRRPSRRVSSPRRPARHGARGGARRRGEDPPRALRRAAASARARTPRRGDAASSARPPPRAQPMRPHASARRGAAAPAPSVALAPPRRPSRLSATRGVFQPLLERRGVAAKPRGDVVDGRARATDASISDAPPDEFHSFDTCAAPPATRSRVQGATLRAQSGGGVVGIGGDAARGASGGGVRLRSARARSDDDVIAAVSAAVDAARQRSRRRRRRRPARARPPQGWRSTSSTELDAHARLLGERQRGGVPATARARARASASPARTTGSSARSRGACALATSSTAPPKRVGGVTSRSGRFPTTPARVRSPRLSRASVLRRGPGFCRCSSPPISISAAPRLRREPNAHRPRRPANRVGPAPSPPRTRGRIVERFVERGAGGTASRTSAANSGGRGGARRRCRASSAASAVSRTTRRASDDGSRTARRLVRRSRPAASRRAPDDHGQSSSRRRARRRASRRPGPSRSRPRPRRRTPPSRASRTTRAASASETAAAADAGKPSPSDT